MAEVISGKWRLALGRTDRLTALLGLLSIVGAIALFLAFRDFRHDDAYITIRYAENLASGLGYSFNPGARVFGSTTPLQTWLLALLHPLVGANLPEAAIAIGASSIAGQAWLIFAMLRPTSARLAVAAYAAMMLGAFGSYSWIALETNLFAALVLGTLYAFSRGARFWTTALFAASFLCRYEGFLLGPVLVAWSVVRRSALPWRELLGAAFLVAPWLVFSGVYFGSPLPNTFEAKQGWSDPIKYVMFHLGGMTRIPGLGYPLLSFTLPKWLGLLAIGSAVLFTWKRSPVLLAAATFAGLQLAAYAVIGPPMNQYWHVYTARMVAQVLAFTGALALANYALQRLGKKTAQFGTSAVAVILLSTLAVHAVNFQAEFRTSFWIGERQRRYEIVASWLHRELGPGARSMLSEEVGTLGVLTGFHMIDPYGLIQPLELPTGERRLSNVVSGRWQKLTGERGARGRGYPAIPKLALRFEPDVILVSNDEVRTWLDNGDIYSVVKVFDWAMLTQATREPGRWSVIAIRREGVVSESRLDELERGVAGPEGPADGDGKNSDRLSASE